MITSWSSPYQQTNAVFARVNYEALYWGSQHGLFVTEITPTTTVPDTVAQPHHKTSESAQNRQHEVKGELRTQWAQKIWIKDALGGPIVVQNIHLGGEGIRSHLASALYSEYLIPVEREKEQKELLRLGSLPEFPNEPAQLDKSFRVSPYSHHCHFIPRRICSKLLVSAKKDYELTLQPLQWILENQRLKELRYAFRKIRKFKPIKLQARPDAERKLYRRAFIAWRDSHFHFLRLRIFTASFVSATRRSMMKGPFYWLLQRVKEEQAVVDAAARQLSYSSKLRVWKKWRSLFRYRTGLRLLNRLRQNYLHRRMRDCFSLWKVHAQLYMDILRRAAFLLRVAYSFWRMKVYTQWSRREKQRILDHAIRVRTVRRWRSLYQYRVTRRRCLRALLRYFEREVLRSAFRLWRSMPTEKVEVRSEPQLLPSPEPSPAKLQPSDHQLCNCLRNYSRGKYRGGVRWCTIHDHLVRRLAEAHEILDSSLSVEKVDAEEKGYHSETLGVTGVLEFSMYSAESRATKRSSDERKEWESEGIHEDMRLFSRPLSQRSPPQQVSWWVDADASVFEHTSLEKTRRSIELEGATDSKHA
eukprot:gb/GECG01015601.1/.p1 GENE.gb/GECG01015601.1/~~gb/GECG01015601.1/.p1  ORF type:complete len:585 (+),score=37.10 gb/GECG01015601.1/:1-1755(+)